MEKETTLKFTKEEVFDMLRGALIRKEIYSGKIQFNIGNDPTWDGPGTLPIFNGITVTIKEKSNKKQTHENQTTQKSN